MAKNIVVCCDGTGNEVGREASAGEKGLRRAIGRKVQFKTKTSNVVKLYRCLPDGEAQITYYNPGVGTLGGQDLWAPAAEALNRLRGLAFGWGLDRDVLGAYRVIAESYREGDRIYLFGFSRGAYTVRILAGLIHLVGLLRPEQLNLAPYAFRAYKRSDRDPTIDTDEVARAIVGMDALATVALIDETAEAVQLAPDEAAAAAGVDLKFFGDPTIEESKRVKKDFRLTQEEKDEADARAIALVEAEQEPAKGDGIDAMSAEAKQDDAAIDKEAIAERAKRRREAIVTERAVSVATLRLALAEKVKVAALQARRQRSDIREAIRRALGGRMVASTGYDPHGLDPREPYARYFGRMVGARQVPIHFLGVWDTVGSVIAPGAFWLIPKIFRMAHIWSNPSVKYFRQAASIDEKRRMFRLEPWIVDQSSAAPVTTKEGGEEPAPARQVWFAGYHSDVGGGFVSEANDVSDFPLRWMLGEAESASLCIDFRMVEHLLKGIPYRDQPPEYVAPAAANPVSSKIHNSMRSLWPLIEWLPHWTSRPVWRKRVRWLPWGGYFPRSEPRIIAEGALIHWSALCRRMHNPCYCPENWPGKFAIAYDQPLPPPDYVPPNCP